METAATQNQTTALPPVMASLYVGDLSPVTTESDLYEAFSNENKTVASVRVCEDTNTGRSLCYGYVNFINTDDAIHAIEMNNSQLNGRVIRVMWSHRDSDGRRSGVGNVFVKNLSDGTDNVALQEMFKQFGNVMSCKVAMFEDGKSKGYGFVQFETEESAVAAIDKLNGFTDAAGKQLYVTKFVRKSERVLPNPDVKYTNLYVKNMDPDVREELLEERFSVFGKIVKLAIAMDDNGISKGFGFVNFESPDDAKRALESLNGSQLGSKVLYVARAQKKAEREQLLRRQFEEKRKEKVLKFKGSNVYLKNIADDVTENELSDHFSQCGTITSVKIMKDEKGISRGFGFVCFSTPEEGHKAVITFHGYMFHRKPLYVAIAQRKEERQAQLQLQYLHRMNGLAGPSAAVIPGGYPHIYYQPPSSVIPPGPPRPGMMYQPMGMRPGWQPNGFGPTSGPSFQPPPVPVMMPQGGPFIPQLQQSTHLTHSKDLLIQQRPGQQKCVPNGRQRKVGGGSQGPEMLSSKLAAATPEQQKNILGEHLFRLVHKHKPELASKITGMLLEMDNSELLLLLESPESLAEKVTEAVQVLKISKKVSSKDSLHSSYLSAEVTVN